MVGFESRLTWAAATIAMCDGCIPAYTDPDFDSRSHNTFEALLLS